MHGINKSWRFKGHGEDPFWRWVCSWGRACRMPSDLRFDNDGFILPDKTEKQYIVEASRPANGMLFTLPAIGLQEEREERRRTIKERCEKIAELVDHKEPVLVWCHLNDEGDLLEQLIPDGLQVAGKHSDDVKEERLLAFARGELRVLITKPKIGAWGLNFQHCSHVTFFPSHSYEQYYQGIRRCWRFGQKNNVKVDIVSTEGEKDILKNLQRKAMQADRMFEKLVFYMKNYLDIKPIKQFNQKERIPEWL
jgi:SNF2 family DNA or RNA helicase